MNNNLSIKRQFRKVMPPTPSYLIASGLDVVSIEGQDIVKQILRQGYSTMLFKREMRKYHKQ
jgi:hypothetical protein